MQNELETIVRQIDDLEELIAADSLRSGNAWLDCFRTRIGTMWNLIHCMDETEAKGRLRTAATSLSMRIRAVAQQSGEEPQDEVKKELVASFKALKDMIVEY
ncbi:MAG: hypothetical protein PHZ00_05215 [Candidatus Peribacteraceae bacterium]|nr:hypothetical protein [Candidatus Peribacteraceae bacterium]